MTDKFVNLKKMFVKEINKIVLIGSGNVATHLALALTNKGKEIIHIYGRTISKVKKLAGKINSSFSDRPEDIPDDAELYIISVSDDAICDVLKKIDFANKLIVHTSGTSHIEILKKSSDNFGIFYPLQTFSADINIDFKNTPICIEANTKENEILLSDLAKSISDNVYVISSEERKILHVCAVFVSNFSNFMYSIADDILEKHNLSFDILKPLILESAKKIISNKPKDVQTGPAFRKDQKTIEEHIDFLSDSEDYKNIYKILSDHIIKGHK